MNSFMSFGIHLACRRLDELGDPLSGLKSLIDWEDFRPIMEGIYDNRTEKGGHPNYDEVLMIKILVLQHWYSLSDQKMELEMAKNISFMRFLDFQEDIPTLRPSGFSKNGLRKKRYSMQFGKNFRDSWMLKDYRLKKVASRMLPSSPQIQADLAIRNEVMKLKLAGAKMVPGPKRARRSISGTNFTTKWMLGMA